MYKDLVINLALLISFLSIGGQLFRKKSIQSSLKVKILAGIFAGIMGTVLMMFSVSLTEYTIIDLRNFSVLIISIYGGWTSGLVAGVVIALSRGIFFGFNHSSIAAALILLFLVISSGIVLKLKIHRFYKFLIMNLLNIISVSTGMVFLIKDQTKLIQIIVHYGIISLVGGIIIYSLCEYIINTNSNLRKMEELAVKDFLTGLNNVRQFDEMWNKYVLKTMNTNKSLSLLIIDIDHFKNVNDKYGHPVGDLILKELGGLLKSTEIYGTVVSRSGGEEFSIICPNSSKETALGIAETLRREVEKHNFTISENNHLKITISIGLSSYPETSIDLNNLIKEADQNLYQAKRMGRNRVYTNDRAEGNHKEISL